MLFTYTPNDQTKEITAQVKCLVSSFVNQTDDPIVWSKHTDNDFLFSFTSSWCRELTVHTLLGLIGPLPPGKLNIYGIRKHSDCWSNQPRDTVGEIDKPNNLVNIYFNNLFRFMIEMFGYVIEVEQPLSSHTSSYWASRLSSSLKVTGLKQQPRCLLNLDEESIPNTTLWKTDNMYGTMYNIPSEWSKSQAIMSYLLYLPRVWGAFYEPTQVLSTLMRSSGLRYDSRTMVRLCGVEEADVSLGLWKYIARRLMLPMWFTSFGRVEFWLFTYMVIREGIAVKKGLSRIPGFQEALTSIKCSGFFSWIRKYKCEPKYNAPDWVNGLYGMLAKRGPHIILSMKPLTSNI